MSAEEIEGVDSGFSDATPAAFSEDSQEAMNNSNNSNINDETSKNYIAEVATKNLTSDLTGNVLKNSKKSEVFTKILRLPGQILAMKRGILSFKFSP